MTYRNSKRLLGSYLIFCYLCQSLGPLNMSFKVLDF
nr:MAG TPA: hypothetical protein [Caudoviricetes sp.]